MKKFLSFLLVAAIAFLACYYFFFSEKEDDNYAAFVASIEENPSMYPLYNRLSDKEQEAYIKICSAAQNFNKKIARVYTGNSKRDVQNFITTLENYLYREIAYEHPEMFWYDPYNFEYAIMTSGNEYYLDITPSYLLDKDQVSQMTPAFETKIERIVSGAKNKKDTYEQVLYVHDYIVSNCAYDYAAYENEDYTSPSINAYGCLVEGKAICSGYAMAFNAVMKRLGYEIGVEFNSYNGLSIFGEGHVWNYCKLDGDYYYFDLTWDDTSPDSEIYKFQPYTHSYFAVTTDELTAAHLTLAPQAETPECTGTKYNYFVYNGLNFSKYDLDTVTPAIRKQADQGYIELRFDSYSELLAAQRDLMTNDKIFDILDISSCKYYTSKSNLQLYILLYD